MPQRQMGNKRLLFYCVQGIKAKKFYRRKQYYKENDEEYLRVQECIPNADETIPDQLLPAFAQLPFKLLFVIWESATRSETNDAQARSIEVDAKEPFFGPGTSGDLTVRGDWTIEIPEGIDV